MHRPRNGRGRNGDGGGGGGGGGGEGYGNEGGERPVRPVRRLRRRPSRLVEEIGPYAGMPSVLVREALRVMPTLVAHGPDAVPGAALAGGGGGGGGGGAAAGPVDRWGTPVHFEVPTESMVMQAPVRIAEFNTLIQKVLDIVVVPVIVSLHTGVINAEAVNELFGLTDRWITPPLQNFIAQLSSRSAAARIVIDTQYYEQYLQRLRDTTHGAHRQAVIDELQEEYSRQLPVLPPAVAAEPSWFKRTWAYIRRRPPPAAEPSIAQMFPPGGAWGGVAPPPPGVAAPVVGVAAAPVVGAPIGPMAPAGLAPAPAAAAGAGAVAAYAPSDRAVSQKSKMLEKRLRKNYKDAADFVKNYRIPGSEGTVEKCPVILKSLHCNLLTVFVHFTEVLIKTIAYRLRREGVLTRAESTAAAQEDTAVGGVEVEVMLGALSTVNFLSREQIESLLEQLILIMVNYMNLSPQFSVLVPLVSQIYSLATIYISIADLDEVRPHNVLLTEVFSEHLMDLVGNIHVRAHNIMKGYVINGDPWFASDGLVGKLGRLAGTLRKFVSEDRRVQLTRMVDEAGRIRVARHEQTRMDVTREAAAVLCDIASPVWVAFDKLMELVDPPEFAETVAVANEGALHAVVNAGVGVGMDTVRFGKRTIRRLNNGLGTRLDRAGATNAAAHLVGVLAPLDDELRAILTNETADQGSYEQYRALLAACKPNLTPEQMAALQPTPVSGMRGMSAAMNNGWTIATEWDRFADFETFMAAFQNYSQSATTDRDYIQFQTYINSREISGHLRHFTYEQLSEIYGIMDYEQDADWVSGYKTLFDLVNAEMARPHRNANRNNNVNNNVNNNGNNNGNNTEGYSENNGNGANGANGMNENQGNGGWANEGNDGWGNEGNAGAGAAWNRGMGNQGNGWNTGRWGNSGWNNGAMGAMGAAGMGNSGNESSNVSNTNNGYGNYWSQNPTSYQEHINRRTRGNKSVEGIKSAKKHRKKIQQSATHGRRRATNRTHRNTGARARRTHRSDRSTGAAQLERNIKMALIGEKYPWGDTPETRAKNYFEFEGGTVDIENCNSIRLLTEISLLRPTTDMRRRMIEVARQRMRYVQTQNSFSPGSPLNKNV